MIVFKSELIEEVAVRGNLKKAEAERAIDSLCAVIAERVAAGDTVAMPPLGRFSYVVRAARKGRNLHTGETIEIPEQATVQFRPSEALRRKLNA
ncbi:HU family DNA-binding protein [Alicyclobacillus sendaiensis]|uniref:HU family DNA-binding protein n=1 Tax=Alicyclobacillus sendaiensis PA2 TaxID=3029425 RepID=A0ABT6Y1V8_ALISE|nr:HU family DNA-binding protein [Alicyclobacillus sendaiensis]MDI9261343.1 HU family DNA-binding protein [Alicyclobacillus sendaiensis PA2]